MPLTTAATWSTVHCWAVVTLSRGVFAHPARGVEPGHGRELAGRGVGGELIAETDVDDDHLSEFKNGA